MAQPDFLVIGAQKAGTTWLDQVFKSSPEIWTPPVKELQFFNEFFMADTFKWTKRHRESNASSFIRYHAERQKIDWQQLSAAIHIGEEKNVDLDWYFKTFDFAPKSCKKGEMTPEYSLLSDNDVGRLASYIPKTKIILCIRDPFARAISGIRMRLLQQGFDKNSDSQSVDNFVTNCASDWDVIERGNYSRIIETFSKHFESSNLLVLLSEDMLNHPQRVILKVSEFLGIDSESFSMNLSKKVHEGLKIDISEIAQNKVRDYQQKNIDWYEKNEEKFRV